MKKDTIYTALDGKTFNNKEECLEYEFENYITKDDLVCYNYTDNAYFEEIDNINNFDFSDYIWIKTEKGLKFINDLFDEGCIRKFRDTGIFLYDISYDGWIDLQDIIYKKEKELDELNNIIKLITEQE